MGKKITNSRRIKRQNEIEIRQIILTVKHKNDRLAYEKARQIIGENMELIFINP